MEESTESQRLSYRQIPEYRNEPETFRFSWSGKIFIFLITMIFCTFFYSYHFSPQINLSSGLNVAAGNLWPSQTIFAEFTFPIFKDYKEYLQEVNTARNKALMVFEQDETAPKQSLKILDILVSNLQDPNNYANPTLKDISPEVLQKFAALSESQRNKDLILIDKVLKIFIIDIYKFGFVNKAVESIKNTEILIHVPPNYESVISKENLTDSSTILDKAQKYLSIKLPSVSRQLALEIISRIGFPNLIYSLSLSENQQKLAEESIARTDGIVRKGETIINKSEIISQSALQKLQSYETSKKLHHENIFTFWYFLGNFGHSSIIYLIILLYLFYIRKRIFFDNFQVAIISAQLILVAFLSWLSIELSSTLPIEFLILIPSFAMLSAVVFDSRTAFYVTVTMSLMLSGIRGNDYDLGISMLFAGTLAAYTVRDIQSRTQMFKSIFYIFIGLTIPITAIGMERSAELSGVINKILLSLLNAGFAPLITFGLLFIFERFSNITTDLKIQEFDNINHPLLVKLSEVAPGTYQHTLSLAGLSEKCAAAINANSRLTKVGAYFHDIGKTVNSEFFTENQIDISNKLDLMTPQKSAEAIRYHVFEGIRLAREYKLPQRIIDFIPMHHGTSIIRHFYAKALEEAGDNIIDTVDFRYQGQKPNSKETAIVMICDSCEALSKVPFKDRDELEKAIEKNIQEKYIDGQLEESNLTFHDLKIVKDICIKYILAITHPRVEYKEIPLDKSDR